jgi:polysaccharide biosynthesis protein PslH
MKLLHMTPELPYAPGGSGGSTRQFHLLRRMCELGHEVAIVAPVHPDQRDGVAAVQNAGMTLFAAPRPAGRVGEVLGALRRRPELAVSPLRDPLLAWQVDVFWTALRPFAQRALASVPDVVLIEHDWAAAWGRALPPGLPRALTLQNLSWLYYRARAEASRGASRALLSIEGRRFLRFDRRLLPEYDLLVTMSELDRSLLSEVGSPPAIAVPNGVDVEAFDPSAPAGRHGDPTLLFTGALGYPPNAEALLWLLREIWPRVLERRPDARLNVVGRGATEEARRLAGDRVNFAGWVPDIGPWFADATVVVVPILSGGGTRLKVLDGLASGRPIVATTRGAEGIDVVDGTHLALANDADAFAATTVRLLADGDERRNLARAARQLAEERYDWRALGDRLAGALAELAEGGRRCVSRPPRLARGQPSPPGGPVACRGGRGGPQRDPGAWTA